MADKEVATAQVHQDEEQREQVREREGSGANSNTEHKRWAINVRLSPQDMVSCDFSNYGCNGGYLTPSVSYLMAEGLVSDECMPYTEEGVCTYQC